MILQIEKPYLKQLQLICEGNVFQIFKKQAKPLQLHNATPGQWPTKKTQNQLTITSTQSICQTIYTPFYKQYKNNKT